MSVVDDAALRASWKAVTGPASSGATTSAEEILMDVKKRSAQFGWKILRRDLVEAAATLFVLGVFGFLAAGTPGALPKLGFVLAVPFIVAPGWRLFGERRRHGRTPSGSSVAEHLEREIRKVSGQISLLSTVADWYIKPLTVGAALIMMTLGAAVAQQFGAGWLVQAVVALAGAAVTVLLFVPVSRFVVWSNRRAVDTELLPMKNRLKNNLAELRGI